MPEEMHTDFRTHQKESSLDNRKVGWDKIEEINPDLYAHLLRENFDLGAQLITSSQLSTLKVNDTIVFIDVEGGRHTDGSFVGVAPIAIRAVVTKIFQEDSIVTVSIRDKQTNRIFAFDYVKGGNLHSQQLVFTTTNLY